jgi:Tol biopolymer transport system component
VVYRADQDTADVFELYSTPLGGGASIKLNSPLVSGGDISTLLFSPDSSQVVYRADQDTDEVFELYRAPAAGGSAPVKLNGPLVSGGNASSSFSLSPDSSRVVYLADQETNDQFELFVTYDEPPAPPTTLIYLPLIVRE